MSDRYPGIATEVVEALRDENAALTARAEKAEADLAVLVRFMRENRAYISATNSAGDASVAFHGPKTVLSADATTLRRLLTEDQT